jgi:hypothetical protein
MTSALTDEISQRVQESLKDSPYVCTSLVKLSGGTANFVYRGTLATPLEDGASTIVIKHTEAYLASGGDFKLPIDRCVSLPISTSSFRNLYLETANTGYRTTSKPSSQLYIISPLSLMKESQPKHQNSTSSLRKHTLKSTPTCLPLWT